MKYVDYKNDHLSQNFCLAEFATSTTQPHLAQKIGFTETEIERLRFACCAILEPLRSRFESPIHITSGKRSEELNRAVGGHPHSHHLFRGSTGAVDITIPGIEPEVVARWTIEHTIVEYAIAYLHRNFVHISFPASSPPPRNLYFNKESQ